MAKTSIDWFNYRINDSILYAPPKGSMNRGQKEYENCILHNIIIYGLDIKTK